MGIGLVEREFGYLGADSSKRGSAMEEDVALMKSLWSEEMVNFEGRHFKLQDAVFLPKPVQGRIPIWIAGNSEGALRRPVWVGDGWHPVGLDLERFRAGAETIAKSGMRLVVSLRVTVTVRKKREDVAGHDGDKRTSFSGTPDGIRSSVGAYQSAGLGYCCASILRPSASEIINDVRKFAKDVIASYG